jgi:hypothetical protein
MKASHPRHLDGAARVPIIHGRNEGPGASLHPSRSKRAGGGGRILGPTKIFLAAMGPASSTGSGQWGCSERRTFCLRSVRLTGEGH